MYFTTPELLVAGEPAVLYVNRRRVRGLEQDPNLKASLRTLAVGHQPVIAVDSRKDCADVWAIEGQPTRMLPCPAERRTIRPND
jgi:hypothetical protein